MFCFILTMWNVKITEKLETKDQLEGFILTMWNVKSTCHVALLLGVPSFILTMWNVKGFKILIIFVVIVGFILTMWNVKNLMDHQAMVFGDRFYLNYVECKDRINHKRKLLSKSFILTMWNVKLADDCKTIKPNKVLS